MSDPAIRCRDDARALLAAGDLAAATLAYLALWSDERAREADCYAVELSFLARDACELCGRHEPAHAAFSALRDALPPPDPRADAASFAAWVILHEILVEPEAVLAWLDHNGTRLDYETALQLEESVVPLLVRRDRWADLARVFPEPARRFLLEAEVADQSPVSVENAENGVFECPRALAGVMARALRAAGRWGDEATLVAAAIAWDGGDEMRAALVGRVVAQA